MLHTAEEIRKQANGIENNTLNISWELTDFNFPAMQKQSLLSVPKL